MTASTWRLRRNFIVRIDVDVEELARELEVLAPWEEVRYEEE
jgi:hypothetical protein